METARARATVPHSGITQRVTGFTGPDSHALAELLGEICYENHTEGRSLLSAVATFKHDPNSVGVGFFNISKQLGFTIGNDDLAKLSFWATQLELVYREYADERHPQRRLDCNADGNGDRSTESRELLTVESWA